MVKFIEQNKKGHECLIDLKIGLIQALAKGELQFKNLIQPFKTEFELNEFNQNNQNAASQRYKYKTNTL